MPSQPCTFQQGAGYQIYLYGKDYKNRENVMLSSIKYKISKFLVLALDYRHSFFSTWNQVGEKS